MEKSSNISYKLTPLRAAKLSTVISLLSTPSLCVNDIYSPLGLQLPSLFHINTLNVFTNWNGNKANQVSILAALSSPPLLPPPPPRISNNFSWSHSDTSECSSSLVNQLLRPVHYFPQRQLPEESFPIEVGLKATWLGQSIRSFIQHTSSSCLWAGGAQGRPRASAHGGRGSVVGDEAGEVKIGGRMEQSWPYKSSWCSRRTLRQTGKQIVVMLVTTILHTSTIRWPKSQALYPHGHV